jgi:hypothetical protein
MLLGFIGLTVMVIFGGIIMKGFEKCISCLKIGDLILDEDIDNYWIALDEEDREWSIKEEENSRNNLGGIKIMPDGSFNKLKQSLSHKDKTLQGVHSYDILANPLYLEAFQYVSAAQEEREKFIIDGDNDEGNDCAQSDLVRIALNLAFVPSSEHQELSFGKQLLQQIKSINGKQTI